MTIAGGPTVILPTNVKRMDMPEPGDIFMTEAGMETELTFHDGIDLPYFCSAVLLDSPQGRRRLRQYFGTFIELASAYGCGVLLETPTWRLSPDWSEKLGLSASDRRRLNFAAVHLLQDLRHEASFDSGRFIVSGNLGPRFDGYRADIQMSGDEAAEYHSEQVELLRESGADCISAMTITNSNEAIGIANAANAAGLPAVISFTLETDGRLPSSESLGEAIDAVDSQAVDAVQYFGINCAHPTHFMDALSREEPWISRIGSIRANASKMSHEELDNATQLDAGDPADLAQDYRRLQALLPGLRVLGGCCGTDHGHVARIFQACIPESRAALTGH